MSHDLVRQAQSPDRASALVQHAFRLVDQHRDDGRAQHLDAAIDAFAQADRLTGPDDPLRGTILLGVGAARWDQFEQTGDEALRTAAIEATSAGLAQMSDGDPRVLWAREQLAIALAPTDPGRSAQVLPDDHPDRAMYLLREAEGLEPDRRLEAYQQAAAIETAPPWLRAAVGSSLGGTAGEQGIWHLATDGWDLAVRMLPLLAPLFDGRAGQRDAAAELVGVAQEAAACAVRAGRLDQAVLMLERGRGLLSERPVPPELLSRAVDVLLELGEPPSAPSDRLALGREWADLAARINPDTGPDLQRLRCSADKGHLVLINAHRTGTDALIVSGCGPVRAVTLPELPFRQFLEPIKRYVTAMLAHDYDETGDYRIEPVLEWLWDQLMEPILRALGNGAPASDGGPWPHVWWCPTGPLALLPLHAAGYHRTGGGRAVIDRVISSYTTTLSVRCRPAPPAADGDRRLVMVAMPHTPGESDLAGVDKEQALLEGLFGPACTVLRGQAATRDAVRDALRRHAWAHLSCHGEQDVNEPGSGHLLLHDGPLDIDELSAGLAGGQFAFLSACHTAVADAVVPDEGQSLAGALQAAGWREIVATLWTVGDWASTVVANDVYRHLTRHGRFQPQDAAEALHHAIRRLRRRRPEPVLWLPFVHFGG